LNGACDGECKEENGKAYSVSSDSTIPELN
jgi:hypothetical protein